MFKYDKATKTYCVGNSRQADVAWTAGFFEGEGSITITKSGKVYFGNCGCEQKSPAPLLKLHSLFGGRLTQRPSGNWEWKLYGHQASAFLQVILPWVQTPLRRKEIVVLKAFFSTTDRDKRNDLLKWWRRRRAAAETERRDSGDGEATVRTSGQPLEVHNNVR